MFKLVKIDFLCSNDGILGGASTKILIVISLVGHFFTQILTFEGFMVILYLLDSLNIYYNLLFYSDY